MNKEIKELFNKYGVKDLKDKNGQSECYCCKNIKHKYSLTWTSFLYEYKENYYCFDCLLTILLQKEYYELQNNWNELKKWLEDEIYNIEPKGTVINYNCEYDSEEDYANAMKERSKLITLKRVLIMLQELERGKE